jgi:hypothetical protein
MRATSFCSVAARDPWAATHSRRKRYALHELHREVRDARRSMESSCTGTMLGCSSCPVICAAVMEPSPRRRQGSTARSRVKRHHDRKVQEFGPLGRFWLRDGSFTRSCDWVSNGHTQAHARFRLRLTAQCLTTHGRGQAYTAAALRVCTGLHAASLSSSSSPPLSSRLLYPPPSAASQHFAICRGIRCRACPPYPRVVSASCSKGH